MTSSIEAPPAARETPQVAVNDIGTAEDFLAAIDATIKYFNDGDIVDGIIVKVDRDEVLLDIGYKTEGVIPSRELSIKHDVDPGDVVAVGDKVEALVLQKEDKEGRLILSKKRAQYERAWGTIEKIKEEDGVVTGSVIEVVKGGLIIDIGLRGFLPASLVEMRRVLDLQPYVGKELEAKIIELDKNRNNVVLSRRAWLEQTQSEVRQNFLTQLQKGQVRPGVVSSIVNFGAFVDLGGVDGLVHVSELSWKHIDHPSEVVEVGQDVTVEVLDVDMDRERVSLSLKATQEDPWQQFARTHQMGQIVPGKVTKLVPFGSFVRVDEGIEGLVHISELAERHVEIPEQVVQVNDDVMVKIIDIDLERRRISLSLKQANEGVDHTSDDFDPTLYGMAATYDKEGNYLYPEGFDAETGEWLEGYDDQKAVWEKQYAEAHTRWEAHKLQVVEANKADVETGEASHYSSDDSASAEGSSADDRGRSSDAGGDSTPKPTAAPDEAADGSLASDEALQALREKLTGGQ
jgi:small subunit ribosomal protein S1